MSYDAVAQEKAWLAVAATVGLALLGVIADYFLKKAGETEPNLGNRYFFLGWTTHSVAVCGWVFALKHLKLAQIGVIYCVATVLFLSALGYWVFNENLNAYEVTGICLAIISILLLSRFS